MEIAGPICTLTTGLALLLCPVLTPQKISLEEDMLLKDT